MSSLLHTWEKDRTVYRLRRNRLDLVESPRLIADLLEHPPRRCTVVRYEDLVSDPEEEIRRICSVLGVGFRTDLLDYGEDLERWTLGDPDTVYQHSRPEPEYAARWMNRLSDPAVWRLARDYVEIMGSTLDALGYDSREMHRELAACRPSWFARSRTVPFLETISPRIRTRILRFWRRDLAAVHQPS